MWHAFANCSCLVHFYRNHPDQDTAGREVDACVMLGSRGGYNSPKWSPGSQGHHKSTMCHQNQVGTCGTGQGGTAPHTSAPSAQPVFRGSLVSTVFTLVLHVPVTCDQTGLFEFTEAPAQLHKL